MKNKLFLVLTGDVWHLLRATLSSEKGMKKVANDQALEGCVRCENKNKMLDQGSLQPLMSLKDGFYKLPLMV